MPMAGGLSMAFAGGTDMAGKKRGLASLNTSAVSSDPLDSCKGDGSSQQQRSWLPPGGLHQALGSGCFSPGALSPLSEAATHTSIGSQRTPLSDALAIASRPRRKVPRHSGFGSLQEGDDAAQSDASDDDGFPGLSETLPAGGWAIAGTPPHIQATRERHLHAAASMPFPQTEFPNTFRPGSVMEGAGRKLRGTEAMRMRNAVLRQTGFLEPTANNMFSDHLEDAVVVQAAGSLS